MLSLSPLRVPRLVRWLASLAALFLVVMTLLRLAAHVAFSREGFSLGDAAPALWLGLRFDARVAAAVVLPVLLFGSVRWIDPFRTTLGRRLWLALLGVAIAALAVGYTADFLHFRYLGQRLNATALGFLADAKLSSAMVWQSYPVLQITIGLALAVAVMVLAVTWLYRKNQHVVDTSSRRGRLVWSVAATLTCAFAMFGRAGQYPLRWSDAFNLRHDVAAQLALNPVESFVSSLGFRRTSFDRAKVLEHYSRMSGYLGVDSPDASRLSFDRFVSSREASTSTLRASKPPNIVLVLCESFSGYKSSMWGNPLQTTPFFASLANEGVFFDNCYTPHFGTARGVWATITGTPDVSPTQTASRNPAMVDQHTIINDFTGYEKLYFLGGSLSWANIRGLVTNNIKGLKLYEEDSYAAPRIDVWGISDKDLFLEADKVLRTQSKPFFAIIQTADNHRPYTIPKADRGEFTMVDLPETTVRQHGFESLAELNAFRYTDYCFRKFFDAARNAPYFDNTVFVFIGDHGIGGMAGAPFPPSWTEQHLTRYHVPLLFYAPKLLPPQRIHSVASMVDVLPTIAGLANVPYRNRTYGRDLLRQQQIDGGASNVAFIIDHNDKTTGIVKQQYYGVQRAGGPMQLVWADFSAPAPAAAPSDAQRADYEALAHAFHETARYLLLNNQKIPAPSVISATHAAIR